MRFLIFNHIQNARESLKGNRLRSFLTMMGITVGVASITAILALSAGASKIVTDQINDLGGNMIVVRPGREAAPNLERLGQMSGQQHYAASTLTESDVESISRVKDVEAVAPLMILTGAVKGSSDAPYNTPIIATTPALAKVNDLDIKDGQFLDEALNDNTTVIGAQLSINTFGTEESIGKTLFVRGQPFTIVGILKRTNSPVNYNGVDLDNTAFINSQSGYTLNQGGIQIQQINVRTTSVASLPAVTEEMTTALLRNHYDQADFSTYSGEAIAQPTNQLFTTITGITTAIAAISLIVGGIGVMNIMLVSVAERTREIGIRKAVGASNTDIVSQFLIESLALAIGGGISGYVVGYSLAFAVSTILTFDPVFTWEIAGIAAAVSLTVGVLFGIYPAIRAARKDPINALRQYE